MVGGGSKRDRMENKVLVIGWFHSNNSGDDLFKEAFSEIFPTFSFTFTNHATKQQVNDHSTIIFGGGSFLDGKPMAASDAFDAMLNKNIYYCGVGLETNVHPLHKALLTKAKGLFVRSNLLKAKELNANSWQIPDLVFALSDGKSKWNGGGGVLFIPNGNLVPKWDEPSWKQNSWLQFKSEMAQSLEILEKEFKVKIFGMCRNESIDDVMCGYEVIASMKQQSCQAFDIYDIRNEIDSDYKCIADFISQFDVVVSQRLHGCILAQCCGVPFVSIVHHDKLKSIEPTGNSMNYYAFNKTDFMAKIHYSLGKSSMTRYGKNDFNHMKNFILETIN